MSNTLIAAISAITAIAAVIITIIQYRERRPHLRVKLSVHDLFIPTFLQTYLTRESLSVEPDVRLKLATLSNLRSYMKLTLKNHGKEKTEPLTLAAIYGNHDYLVQMDNQPELLLPVEGKLPIGYLPSKGGRADTFYKTSFKFPFPTYVQDIIRGRAMILFLIFIALLTFSPLYKYFLPSWCP